MPQRFLRPGITTSAAWNAISWQAQSFYIRLITLVDDFGRYDARWQILRSHAFPLNDEITQKQMHTLCEQLHANDLAVFYRAPDGKEYVQLTKWREKARSEPRFPTFDDTCEQMFAIVNKCSPPSPSPSPSPSVLPQQMNAVNGRVSVEQAVAQCNGPIGVPEDFARYVFDDWDSREGKDASDVKVGWPGYVKKRWNREGEEWRQGVHKGQKKVIVSKNTNPQNYIT